MVAQNRFIILSIIILSCLPVRAQIHNVQQFELAEKLNSLASKAPPEIAYIQTSKDIYEPGEDLWFKVYMLDAQYLFPSVMSKTLYLQLLSEKTKAAVWQEKYEIQNGFANGRVYLESSLPEGHYLLAAYTPGTFFNDSTEFKAIRKIRIVHDITVIAPIMNEHSVENSVETIKADKYNAGKAEKETVVTPLTGKENHIQFNTFPESGHLVSGIRSRLAFKAVGVNGEPVEIKGTLFENDSPLVEFKSIHAGMGSLYFTPDTGKKYCIRLSEPDIDSTFILPEVYPTGLTIGLSDRNKESISFIVSQSAGLKEEDIYLRIQCRGVVYALTAAKLNKELKLNMPLKELPQGIAEVTLFNSDLLPVAERLVYINNDRKLNITAELLKNKYSTREKVTIKITARDENNKPAMANLGVTVFDNLYQNPLDSSNILSHIYLSSQIKGRIYYPSFYFNCHNKNRDEALDLLMLTQGWRNYIWSETNLKRFEAAPEQMIYDEIYGNFQNLSGKKRKSAEQLFVMAFSPSKDSSKVFIWADSSGAFSVSADLLKKWENDYIFLKPLGSSKSTPVIRLTDPFNTINTIMKSRELSYPEPCLIEKKKDPVIVLPKLRSDVISIDEVIIKSPKRNIIRGKYMGLLDSLAKNYDWNTDYVCRYNVLNCRRHQNEPDNRKPVYGESYLDQDNGYRPTIYTVRKNSFTEEELLKLFNLSRVKSYYGYRTFYKPDYDKTTGDEMIPDFRNTLLWEPSVLTNEKGEAILSFFCSDINSDFTGRIEGVDSNGLLGADVFNFIVRKQTLPR